MIRTYLYTLIYITILLAFGFGWFFVRPAVIRHDCMKVVNTLVSKAVFYTDTRVANNKYRYCLAERGLKPESLMDSFYSL